MKILLSNFQLKSKMKEMMKIKFDIDEEIKIKKDNCLS